MNVRWSVRARRQLRRIRREIAVNAPMAADRLLQRIADRTDQIAAFPYSGRIVPEHGVEFLREMIERPYRIIYRIRNGEAEIVMIIHGARKLR